MKKLKSFVRTGLLLLLGMILGLRLYLWNAQSLMGNAMPMPFGYGAAVVLSGSMEPTFSKGDLIIVKETTELQQNDIVVFEDGSSLIVHRIIDIGEETITTKGDANYADDGPISASVIVGKVLFWIPNAGTVISFLKTPAGTLCTIILAIILIELPRRKQAEKDDEARQKILDEIHRLKDEL